MRRQRLRDIRTVGYDARLPWPALVDAVEPLCRRGVVQEAVRLVQQVVLLKDISQLKRAVGSDDLSQPGHAHKEARSGAGTSLHAHTHEHAHAHAIERRDTVR